MVRKYHNQKLQTNPWHREEEVRNTHPPQGIHRGSYVSRLLLSTGSTHEDPSRHYGKSLAAT